MMENNGVGRFGKRPTVHPGEVLIGARCWACDSLRYKTVQGRNSHHAHFAWSCEDCAVDWIGPGTIVADQVERSAS